MYKKYIREPNRELLEQAQRETLAAAEEFARVLPLTRRGVALKAAAAYRSLRSNAEYGPVDEILRLFNTNAKVDGQWLHDLRALSANMEADGEYPEVAVQCLESILASLIMPRHA